MKKLWELFLTFFKISAFTFGGGYAMLALIEAEVVEKKQWLDKDEFLDMIAIAESTPGPVAINSATYVGYRQGGAAGAAAATVGVFLPSFVIIYVISLFLDRFLAFKYVGYAFRGIQVCVVYLIFSAGLRTLKSLEKSAMNIVIVAAVVCLMTAFALLSVRFSSIYFILICGALGLAVSAVRGKGERK